MKKHSPNKKKSFVIIGGAGPSPLRMKFCSCGGNKKLILDDYAISTRIPERRKIVVENVRYKQCNICGRMELTEDSQKMIDLLKEYYTNQYYPEDKYEKLDYNEPNFMRDFIKNFRF